MEKRASNGEHFKERIAILSYFISLGEFTEDDVEEAYKNLNSSWKARIFALEQKYDKVSICSLFNDRIGEVIPRYLYAVRNKEMLPDNELEIFIGVRGWCNKCLKKMMERYITIVDFSDKFWIYFVLTFSGTINLDKENKYSDREEFERSYFIPSQTMNLLELTNQEEQNGIQKARSIGINEPFICFSNRDAAYLDKLYPQGDWSYHNYRDSHIENYELMTSSFAEKKIQAVRMGRTVLKRADFDNCIDFASNHYDELLDIYLMSRCKFFIGDESGINVLPRALGKPVVTVNLVTVTGYGGIPLREDNLFIFKKFYDIKNDKFLNLKEMCQVLLECRYKTGEYEKKGIRLIENTPEEIMDVANEMNDYLDGTSSIDEEGQALQEEASEILKDHFKNNGLGFNETLIGKMGCSFLKKNRYLLA